MMNRHQDMQDKHPRRGSISLRVLKWDNFPHRQNRGGGWGGKIKDYKMVDGDKPLWASSWMQFDPYAKYPLQLLMCSPTCDQMRIQAEKDPIF